MICNGGQNICIQCQKKLQYPNITKVTYTDESMHGWGYTVKEPEQEDHGLTQKRIGTSMHKCSRIKIYLFKSTSKSHVNCEG